MFPYWMHQYEYWRQTSRNLVLLAIAHSNTSIITHAAHALGWNLPDAINNKFEPLEFITINQMLIDGGFMLTDEFRYRQMTFLKNCKQPCVLKDPRLILTMPCWMEAFRDSRFDPVLIWITKDIKTIEETHHQLGELDADRLVSGSTHTIKDLFDKSVQLYREWPGDKFVMNVETIIHAASILRAAGTSGSDDEIGLEPDQVPTEVEEDNPTEGNNGEA